MTRKQLFLCLVGCLLMAPLAWSAKPQYISAKVVQVERKTRQKVDMYLVNTPVTTDVPYFEIKLRVGQTDYKAEYTPRHDEEELPGEWVEDADVMIRLENHTLYLKRPEGTEMKWLLTKRTTVKETGVKEKKGKGIENK